MTKKLTAAIPLLLLVSVLPFSGGGCGDSGSSTGPTISASSNITGLWQASMERRTGADCFTGDLTPEVFKIKFIIAQSGDGYEVTFIERDQNVVAAAHITFDDTAKDRFTLTADKIDQDQNCVYTEEYTIDGKFKTENEVNGFYKDLAYYTGTCPTAPFAVCDITGSFTMTRQ